MGEVKVRGLEATSFYLGSVLNKLGVTVNVAKAGAYKSAPEMFTNSAPSEDALTAQRFWLNDEWAQLSSAMETGRGLSQGYLKTWMDNYLDNLRRAGGDAARMAKETGLVNGIATGMTQKPPRRGMTVSRVPARVNSRLSESISECVLFRTRAVTAQWVS